MNCNNCGAEIKDNQKFCPKCGRKIDVSNDSNLSVTRIKPNLNKKKIIIAVIVVILVILITIFAVISNSPKYEGTIYDLDKNKTTQTIPETTQSTTITTTKEHKLSDDCTYVLAGGYDGDDYYELVANQIDGYPDSTFEVGVIKNNEWLVEMNASSPFLEDNGWWKGLDQSYQENIPPEDSFEYIGQGCFLFSNNIIYNPETGVIFYNLCNRDYSLMNNVDEFVGFEDYHEDGTASHKIAFKYFNTKTGETKKIKGFFDDENIQQPNELHDISDGLFFAKGKTLTWSNFQYVEYCGFFDLNGNLIVDLSEYTVVKTDDYHDYIFKNGQYTITCQNNSGISYDITFDTTGKIINQEKSN